MPVDDDARPPSPEPPAKAPADTLIDHLARRLGWVRDRFGATGAVTDGEARADALSGQGDTVEAIRLLVPAMPARTLSGAAMQLALAYRAADVAAEAADREDRAEADAMVMRLVASALLCLLDADGVRVDPAAL